MNKYHNQLMNMESSVSGLLCLLVFKIVQEGLFPVVTL